MSAWHVISHSAAVMVSPLGFHQSVPGSMPGDLVICRLCLLLALALFQWFFSRFSNFSCPLKAGLHVRHKRKRKNKSKCKRPSHVGRKREQNEIRTRTSVSQDGGNLVPRVQVTLEQLSGNEDSGYAD